MCVCLCVCVCVCYTAVILPRNISYLYIIFVSAAARGRVQSHSLDKRIKSMDEGMNQALQETPALSRPLFQWAGGWWVAGGGWESMPFRPSRREKICIINALKRRANDRQLRGIVSKIKAAAPTPPTPPTPPPINDPAAPAAREEIQKCIN